MAKKSVVLRNSKRKYMYVLHESKRLKCMAAIKDESLPFEDRLLAQIKLSELPRDGSKSRYRNRCHITGRPRGNLRKFGLSRNVLRDMASWGSVPGLIKSSW